MMKAFIIDETVKLRSVDNDDLGLILSWRNDPLVSQLMLSSAEITEHEHRRWYVSASADPRMRLLLAEGEKTGPIGFVQFSRVDRGGSIDWGFYTVPGCAKGAGHKLGEIALKFAFLTIGAHKVCGKVLEFNDRSRAFHLAMGFVEEGCLREEHKVADKHYDLFCFGILRSEWLLSHQNVSDEY